MNLLNKISNALETYGPTIIAVGAVNNWINNKNNEISYPNDKILPMITIAREVGNMDGETWKVVSGALEMKVLYNNGYEFLRNFCYTVVNIEVGKLKQLLSLNISESSILFHSVFFGSSIEEQCAYIGLLQSRSHDIKADYLLKYIIKSLGN